MTLTITNAIRFGSLYQDFIKHETVVGLLFSIARHETEILIPESVSVVFGVERFFTKESDDNFFERLSCFSERLSEKYPVKKLSLYDGSGSISYDGNTGELHISID